MLLARAVTVRVTMATLLFLAHPLREELAQVCLHKPARSVDVALGYLHGTSPSFANATKPGFRYCASPLPHPHVWN